MSLVRYSACQPVFARQGDFKHVFERLFGDVDSDQSARQWAPRVDIREETNRFVILADIPGVDPKDIEIHMEKNVLVIKGERTAEAKDETQRYSRVERVHGSFVRRFELPETADAESISATGRHGVLEVSIPKKAETAPRRIQVQ